MNSVEMIMSIPAENLEVEIIKEELIRELGGVAGMPSTDGSVMSVVVL